ncbi:uncharacterized protein LOC112169866 [Rosa chinensis]|uniref:uncharacterized protein LOC112169866 n=1 Tax=Rosa chinensis TaxID=74649 RepID=UPI000D09497A|nr:uncharacterized protein LOC112169866 [Rosa chinensis]
MVSKQFEIVCHYSPEQIFLSDSDTPFRKFEHILEHIWGHGGCILNIIQGKLSCLNRNGWYGKIGEQKLLGGVCSNWPWKFGPNCVERVYVHRPVGQPPLFGKVVFRSVLMPALVLEGKDLQKYLVDGYPIWCKKYDRKKAQQSRQLEP